MNLLMIELYVISFCLYLINYLKKFWLLLTRTLLVRHNAHDQGDSRSYIQLENHFGTLIFELIIIQLYNIFQFQ